MVRAQLPPTKVADGAETEEGGAVQHWLYPLSIPVVMNTRNHTDDFGSRRVRQGGIGFCHYKEILWINHNHISKASPVTWWELLKEKHKRKMGFFYLWQISLEAGFRFPVSK